MGKWKICGKTMRGLVAFCVTAVLCLTGGAAFAEPVESFDAFIQNFEPKAIAAGVTPQTYKAAMEGLTPDPNVPALIASQPEFTTPLWDYLDQRVTPDRIARGKKAMAANHALFETIGQEYGVDPAILAAIWGIETDYGAVLGNSKLIRPVIRSLATLVHQRRSRLNEDEQDLIAALLLVQRNGEMPAELVGSWAGAIGHLQVNPSNVLAYEVDGDGNGRIDLHTSLADALATSANYLRQLGYQPGMDWGFEVELPAGFDYALAGRTQYHPMGFFAERGVKRVKGRPLPDRQTPVFLYVPAGINGPKFLMTPNYLVLKGYNFSDSYAMSVAHMADRLKGSQPFVADWPRGTQFPNLKQRIAIQQALVDLGLYQGAVDGRIGPVSQDAYARFQANNGQVPDGFITLQSYNDLVKARR
jgi:membrane-bound lytic murein transglycosylase B